jgi:hypothetical protein
LFVSGRLDNTMGGRPVDTAGDSQCRRRSVYGLVDRQNLPQVFRAFDFPAPDQCLERRPYTSVPQQALFSLNSPFVFTQAQALVARVDSLNPARSQDRLDGLFRLVYGRHATKQEVNDCLTFLDSKAASPVKEDTMPPWEQLAQVLLISNEALFLD